MLTQTLRRLQSRGLVTKVRGAGHTSAHAGVVYQLSPLGKSFANGPLAQLAQWAADNQAELAGPPATS
jgi:DNA-binding HxlR family transcriptional regulator